MTSVSSGTSRLIELTQGVLTLFDQLLEVFFGLLEFIVQFLSGLVSFIRSRKNTRSGAGNSTETSDRYDSACVFHGFFSFRGSLGPTEGPSRSLCPSFIEYKK